jgi:hypothetical protein
MLHIIITWCPLDAKVTNNFLLLPPPPCNSGFVFDNRWVVPYNPYLTMWYQCHINVEVCSSITAVKYLYKYVYKGHDRAFGSGAARSWGFAGCSASGGCRWGRWEQCACRPG